MPTQLIDNREVALRIGYEATDWGITISFSDYCDAMKDWTMKAIIRDGDPIGTFFKRDDEIHVSVIPKWRKLWATKGLLREILNGSKLSTKISNGHDHMYGIMNRLGFKKADNGLLIKEI